MALPLRVLSCPFCGLLALACIFRKALLAYTYPSIATSAAAVKPRVYVTIVAVLTFLPLQAHT